MIPNSLSSSYVVNAPAAFLRQFSQKTKQQETPIHTQTLMRLIESFIELIRSFYEESLKMSPQEARTMLNEQEIDSLLAEALAVKSLIPQTENTALQAAMTSLVAYSEALAMRVYDIANSHKVAETSEDYAQFWIEEAEKARIQKGAKTFVNSSDFLTYIQNI